MEQGNKGKTERLTMTIEEAGEALGISRATAYSLANSGGLPAIRISERRLIVPRKAIDELLASASKQRDIEEVTEHGTETRRRHNSEM
jgi:excisionase family DNA binding protein